MKKIIFILLIVSCNRHVKTHDEEIESQYKLLHQEYPTKIVKWKSLSPERDEQKNKESTIISTADLIKNSIKEIKRIAFPINHLSNLNNSPKKQLYSFDEQKQLDLESIETDYLYKNDTIYSLEKYDEKGNLYYYYDNQKNWCSQYFKKYIYSANGYLINEVTLNKNLIETSKIIYEYRNNLVCKSYDTYDNNNDTITYFYDSKNQLIKKIDSRHTDIDDRAGEKRLFYVNEIYNYSYDEFGNLIEWRITYDASKGFAICGNTTTHWTGKYDKDGFLISSISNGFDYIQDYTKKDSTISISKDYYKNGKLKSFKREDTGAYKYISTSFYKYYQ